MSSDGTLSWGVHAQIVLKTAWADRELVVTLGSVGNTWIVIALETKRTPKELSVQAIEGALEGHAHQTLGTYGSLAEASERAELFARDWLTSRGCQPCECGPIETGRVPS